MLLLLSWPCDELGILCWLPILMEHDVIMMLTITNVQLGRSHTNDLNQILLDYKRTTHAPIVLPRNLD